MKIKALTLAAVVGCAAPLAVANAAPEHIMISRNGETVLRKGTAEAVSFDGSYAEAVGVNAFAAAPAHGDHVVVTGDRSVGSIRYLPDFPQGDSRIVINGSSVDLQIIGGGNEVAINGSNAVVELTGTYNKLLNRTGPDGDSRYWISTRGWSVRFVA